MTGLLAVVIRILIVGAYVAACTGANSAKGVTQVIEHRDILPRLDTLDDASRMRLLSGVDQERNELLGGLLRYLGPGSSPYVQAAAMYLIGRYRLSNGVRDLIARIDFETGQPLQRGPEPLWERFPAMEALIAIGTPSVSPAIELLATDTASLRRELAVKVVRYVEGPEVAEFILQRAAVHADGNVRKQNLDDALVQLRKLIAETK